MLYRFIVPARNFLLLILIINVYSVSGQHIWKHENSGGYPYQYVVGDPMNTRFYTLKNGLTVALSVNHKEPRIAVRIPVRTGSNNDPKEHTGLAHYLEHLLFKGTNLYGSLDWAKEKPYLDQIDALYETYNSTSDVEKRKGIYHQIDSVSGLASQYAIANEYEKLMASLGAQGSNAHTWVEETVYEEDIPSNGIDKFLLVQAERFREPVFRLFHTELEAVYEEKNRTLDNDNAKIQEAEHDMLFPTHNYGRHTTIGTIEHLKNPSLKAIRAYYYQYYVPNNMAIVMAGDFDPEQVIKKIDAAFSYMKPHPVKEYEGPKEATIAGPVVKEIFGPSAESMRIAYRVGPSGSRDEVLALLVSSILSNGKAGLLDLNLNKQQKVLGAGAGVRQYKDYGIFQLAASPKTGQTLEDVKDLLLAQVKLLKEGNFDASLLKAIVANFKLSRLQELENNAARVENITDEFIKNKDKEWDKEVALMDDLSRISKEEVVTFANRFFTSSDYVVIYKRKGEDKTIVKVDKPPITPVQTNAGKQSPFVARLTQIPLPPIKPLWLDFTKDIQQGKSGIADVLYVQNHDNALFRMYYNFNFGSYSSKVLPVAMQYLQFLGTDKISAEDISRQFYNLAASFSVSTMGEETRISLSGLNENFEAAARLFEDLVTHCKADDAALESLKGRILKSRANNKLNKNFISSGLRLYATYGPKNPFNNQLTDGELQDLKSDDLVSMIHDLMKHQHMILYYGPMTLQGLTASIQKIHHTPSAWSSFPAAIHFDRVQPAANNVLFADYDQVQAEVFWTRPLDHYDPKQEVLVDLYNNYFGGGMGSVVFQTIRESKALAYSTFAVVQTPTKKEDLYSFIAYVGSQADKMKEAINGMNELLDVLPAAEQNFAHAKESLKKDLETERVTRDDIMFAYLNAKKKGLSTDLRKAKYEALNGLTLKDLVSYHDQRLSHQPYTYCILASEKKINLGDLKKFGDVKKLTLEEIFGY